MKDDEKDDSYGTVGALTGIIVFIGVWIYAISQWGLLIGLMLGWIPAVIAGFIGGFLWPFVWFILIYIGYLVFKK